MTVTILSLLMKYKYLMLFPLAAIEGPIVALVVGFLVHQGVFSVVPAFAILILGDIIPDAIYYLIGRQGDKKLVLKKYADKFKIVSGGATVMDRLWEEHPRKTMFLSKLAYGLTIPFLISAGLSKISYKNFFFYTIPATLFQYGVLMLVGYLLGKSYEMATSYVQYWGIFFAVVLLVFIALYVWIILYSRKEIKNH